MPTQQLPCTFYSLIHPFDTRASHYTSEWRMGNFDVLLLLYLAKKRHRKSIQILSDIYLSKQWWCITTPSRAVFSLLRYYCSCVLVGHHKWCWECCCAHPSNGLGQSACQRASRAQRGWLRSDDSRPICQPYDVTRISSILARHKPQHNCLTLMMEKTFQKSTNTIS